LNKRLILALFYGAFLITTLSLLFHAGGYDRLLCRTFLASEWMIGEWINLGYTAWFATPIATAIGNIADCHWWALVFFGMKELRRILENRPAIKRWVPWLWHRKPTDAELKSWRYRWGYRAIPFLCCIPGGSALGTFMMAEFLDFDPMKTLHRALIGNTIKGIYCGIAFAFAMKIPEFRKNVHPVSLVSPFLVPIPFWIYNKIKQSSSRVVMKLNCAPEEE
jgi:hypothetical protein